MNRRHSLPQVTQCGHPGRTLGFRRSTRSAAPLLVLGALLITTAACRTRTREPAGLLQVAGELASPRSVPEWAHTGLYRSARWDGGPIEAEKGIISGWPHFTRADERGVVAATRDWYNPRTVEFLRIAHVNWAWVTWSNGFSHQTEKQQWDLLKTYIAECHRNGIKVAAYLSIGNMFWNDMFRVVPESIRWVQILPNGSPALYGKRNPLRYMADIRREKWIDYVKVRVRAATEAGADAFWIDNTNEDYHRAGDVKHFLREIYAEARRAGRKPVVMSNYNHRLYTWARFQNGVTTEDGDEPGYYAEEPEGQRLVTNAGLLRYQYGISEGWRPVSVEYGGRHRGDRVTTPMEARKWQLSLAEAAAFQVSLEPFFEGMFLRNLYYGDSEALEELRAIGKYNAFFEEHEEYYTEPRSVALIGIVSDTTDRAVPLLNDLARRNVQFDVLFNYQDPSLEKLETYRVLVVPETNPLSDLLCARLSRFVKDGGSLIATQGASLFDPAGSPREEFGLAGILNVSLRRPPRGRTLANRGHGRAIYFPTSPEPRVLAAELKRLAGREEAVTVEAPSTVLYNVVRQPARRRLVLHLLNYAQRPVRGIAVRVRGRVSEVTALSPDRAIGQGISVAFNDGESAFQAPELRTYNLVSISMK